jgi:hypothetical protein
MSEKDLTKSDGFLAPSEFRGWLTQEIADSAKAHELRIKEATEFVNQYESGLISAEEANERLKRYDRRWGEALFGASAMGGISDDGIINAIDESRETQSQSPAGTHSAKFIRRDTSDTEKNR